MSRRKKAVRKRGTPLRNPSATAWVLAAAVGAAAIATISGVAFARSRRLPSVDDPPVACDPSPYPLDAQVMQTIELALIDVIRRGGTDPTLAAQEVASELFSVHPSGNLVVFPPGPSAWPGVACVWSVVLALTEVVFARTDVGPPGGDVGFTLVSANDPGYPWEGFALHHENYPTPSTWLNANDRTGSWSPSQGYDELVRALLGSALAMAGADLGIAWAEGQDPRAALGRDLRRQVRQAITVVGGVNDLLYGQTNLNYAGGNDPSKPGGNPNAPRTGDHVLNAEGRSLNWLPHHADQLQRFLDVQPLLRTTGISGERLRPRRGNEQMLIWQPAFDLAALAEQVPRIAFLQWPDGSSTLHPPPLISARGVDMQGIQLPGVTA